MMKPLDDVWEQRFRTDLDADETVERRLLFKEIAIIVITLALIVLREVLT